MDIIGKRGNSQMQLEPLPRSFVFYDRNRDGFIDYNEFCDTLRLDPTDENNRENFESGLGDANGKTRIHCYVS